MSLPAVCTAHPTSTQAPCHAFGQGDTDVLSHMHPRRFPALVVRCRRRTEHRKPHQPEQLPRRRTLMLLLQGRVRSLQSWRQALPPLPASSPDPAPRQESIVERHEGRPQEMDVSEEASGVLSDSPLTGWLDSEQRAPPALPCRAASARSPATSIEDDPQATHMTFSGRIPSAAVLAGGEVEDWDQGGIRVKGRLGATCGAKATRHSTADQARPLGGGLYEHCAQLLDRAAAAWRAT